MEAELCSRACRRGGEELGRAVLPSVLERVRGLTRQMEPARWEQAPWEASDGMRDAGFLLGVIAAARGVDLLLARREVDGLRGVVRWVGAAVGARIEPESAELPLVSTRLGRGWEIPFLGACLFLRAARLHGGHGEERGQGALSWSVEPRGGSTALVVARPRRDAEDDAFLAELAPLVPGSEALAEDERFGFRWPSAWLG